MIVQQNENIKKLNEVPIIKNNKVESIILPKTNESQNANKQQIKLPAWSIEPPIEISRGQK